MRSKKETAKTNWVTLVILFLVVVSLGVGIYLWQKNKEKIYSINTKSANLDAKNQYQKIKTFEIVSLDDTWNKYINYELGFSLKIPKKIAIGCCNGSWKLSEEIGIWENQMTNGPREFYLRPLNVYYEQSEECIERRWYKLDGFGIVLEKVKNEKELEDFIKKYYCFDCKAGNRKLTNQEGVFEVKIEGISWDYYKEKEPNYTTVVKYFPEKNIVASMNLRSDDCLFYAYDPNYRSCAKICYEGVCNPPCYDKEILNSFKFE